jgi:HEAT repeat protein
MRVCFLALPTLLLLVWTAPLAAQGRGTGKRPPPKEKSKPPAPSALDTKWPTEWGGKTLKEWAKDLSDPDPSRRADAMFALPNFGEPAADYVPKLLERCNSERDTSPRVKAVIALRFIAVKDKDETKVVATLARRLSYESEPQTIVRFEAARTLRRFVPHIYPALNALLRGAKDYGCWEVRQECVAILWRSQAEGVNGKSNKLPERSVSLTLVDVMKTDRARKVVLEAIQGLGWMGRHDPAVEPKVFAALSDRAHTGAGKTSQILALWANTALINLNYRTDIQVKAMARFLKAKDNEVRAQAAQAIGALGKRAKPLLPNLLAMLQDDNTAVVQGACSALARAGDKGDAQVIDGLLDVAGDRNPLRAYSALLALVEMKANSQKVVSALEKIKLRKETDDRLRPVIGEAITKLTGAAK